LFSTGDCAQHDSDELEWPSPCRFCFTPTTFADVTDGTSNTLAVVEMSDSAILWTEPRDLDVWQMSLAINAPGGVAIRSNHPGGANVLMLDGSVHFLSEQVPAEHLKALVTRAGNKPPQPLNY
jgi:prepilin-type processing-associated H-X9-DG protein